jgi:phospholipid/cholesterol/gamma-HCH transport system ATP-binding protein
MPARVSTENNSLPDAVVQIRDLHFSHGDRMIFNGINLDIAAGEITAIMGPSGTGKTTLLKLIGGQLRPASGSIRVHGEEVPALSRKALYRLRKRMGMLFQSGALLTDITVFENVAYPIREHTRLPEPLIRDLVLMKLQAVGLRGAAGLMPAELSGGMARRVALARAIALDPMMVLYDEPFTGQDPISMGILVKLIRELNDLLTHCGIQALNGHSSSLRDGQMVPPPFITRHRISRTICCVAAGPTDAGLTAGTGQGYAALF